MRHIVRATGKTICTARTQYLRGDVIKIRKEGRSFCFVFAICWEGEKSIYSMFTNMYDVRGLLLRGEGDARARKRERERERAKSKSPRGRDERRQDEIDDETRDSGSTWGEDREPEKARGGPTTRRKSRTRLQSNA